MIFLGFLLEVVSGLAQPAERVDGDHILPLPEGFRTAQKLVQQGLSGYRVGPVSAG